ncbi:MAG: MerC domain-containing protein [Parasphingorhabdus sp.]
MSPQYANRLESSALFLSGLCILHCLGLPLLFAALPALSTVLELPEVFHFNLVVTALPLSLTVLAFGMHQHRSLTPLVIGAMGLLSMMAALTEQFHSNEVILTVVGATGLALAHIANWRRRSLCAANSSI